MSTHDLKDLLDAESASVGDVDLSGAAWAAARREQQRRRRRVTGSLLAAAACGAVVLSVVRPWDPAATSGPAGTGGSSSPSVASSGPSASAPVAGQPVVSELPDPDEVAALPAYPLEHPLAGEHDLPAEATSWSATDGFRPGERLVGAWALADAREVGVLTSDDRNLALDDLSLQDTSDPSGNHHFGLSNGSIAADGSLLAIAQPGAVVLVDPSAAGTASPWRTVAIDDEHLESAAVVDPSTVLVTSETATYVVDVATGRVTATLDPVWDAAPVVLRGFPANGESVTLRHWDPERMAFTAPEDVAGAPFGEVWGLGASQASGNGWVAALVSPDFTTGQKHDGAYQGIALVGVREPHAIQLLLDVAGQRGGSSGITRGKGGIRPLAFDADGRLLMEVDGGYPGDGTGSMTHLDVLAWDPLTRTMSRVGSLVGDPVQVVLATPVP